MEGERVKVKPGLKPAACASNQEERGEEEIVTCLLLGRWGGGYKAKLPGARREGLSLGSFSTQLSSHLYFGLSQILMCSCNMAGDFFPARNCHFYDIKRSFSPLLWTTDILLKSSIVHWVYFLQWSPWISDMTNTKTIKCNLVGKTANYFL